MTKEAELHAEEDKLKERVENRNQLDSTVYQMEKMLSEAGDKLPEDKEGPIEAGLADAKKALESEDSDQIKESIGRFEQAWSGSVPSCSGWRRHAEHGRHGGRSWRAPPSPSGEGNEPPSLQPADVVDADFEVVEDDDSKEKINCNGISVSMYLHCSYWNPAN